MKIKTTKTSITGDNGFTHHFTLHELVEEKEEKLPSLEYTGKWMGINHKPDTSWKGEDDKTDSLWKK